MTLSQQYPTKAIIEPGKSSAGKLDHTDIGLLREIFQGRTVLPLAPDFRKSFRMIARAMKLDEDTIRRRVARLEMGFIRGWRIILNPRVLGMTETVVDFDVPARVSKDELIRKLRLVPGIFLIANFYGSFLGVILRWTRELSFQKIVSLIKSLAEATSIHCAHSPWPECRMHLTETDWKIIASLYRNPRKSFTSISNELGISSRTAHRRLKEMMDNAVLLAVAAINPKALDGTILACLQVGCKAQDGIEVRRRVTAFLDAVIWHVYQTVPMEEVDLQYTYFNLALPNISKAHEISDLIREQAGVKACRLEFYEDHLILFQTLEEQLCGRGTAMWS